MTRLGVAFVAGIVFAVGLGVSGMTDPQKVLGFLDVTGHWDPTLGFVMFGALAVHVGPARWALRARRPLLADAFALPTRTRIDSDLLLGSALFGIGWGMAGYCPGPALVDLVAPSPSLLVFALAMVVGIAVFQGARRTSSAIPAPSLQQPSRHAPLSTGRRT